LIQPFEILDKIYETGRTIVGYAKAKNDRFALRAHEKLETK